VPHSQTFFSSYDLSEAAWIRACVSKYLQAFHGRVPGEFFAELGLRLLISLRDEYPWLAVPPRCDWFVASLDRKCLGQKSVRESGTWLRGIFDKETRRKPLAVAADALSYGD
jgi:hypothetical protein